jgi:hypothetical protein
MSGHLNRLMFNNQHLHIRMFKVCFIAHARDADLTKHRSIIETDTYRLHSVVVRNQGEAVEVTRRLVEEEGVQSILLCPGFTHQNVAEIQETVKGKAGVFVARGDGPSSSITRKARTGR